MPDVITTPKTSMPSESSWDQWKKQVDYRQLIEGQWNLNIAFLIGKHSAQWNRAAKRLQDSSAFEVDTITQPRRSKVISNHVLRLFRQKLSDFVKMKPAIHVEPVSEEADDIKSAELSQNTCLYLQHKHLFQAIERRRWTLQMCFGQASLYPCWNPKKGPMGDEELLLLSPFETYWPLGRWPDAPNEVFVVQAMGIDEIAERFNKEIAEEREVFASPVEQQIRYLLNQTEESGEGRRMARILTHFKLPCRSYPDGLYRVEAPEGQVLHDGVLRDMPWYFDDEGNAHLPVTKFDFYEIPMSRYGQAFIEPLISPQREYNYKISRITDHFRKFSGKLLVPFNAGLKEPVNNRDDVMFWDPSAGGVPAMMNPPGIPASMFQDLQRAKLDMEDLAASHDVSNARMPQGVKSGVAIAHLQEGDSSQMAPIVLAAEEAMATVWKTLLSIVRHNYQEERTLQIVGEGKRFQIPNFRGEQIMGNHVLRVSLGSEHAFSKTTRQQMAIELYMAAGAEGGLVSREEAREMIQLIPNEPLAENVQELAAKEAIKNMLKGVLVEVNAFDDHALHLKLINNVRSDPNFQATAPQDIKMIFELVADLRMKALAQEMAARQMGPQPAAMPNAQQSGPPSQNGAPPQ